MLNPVLVRSGALNVPLNSFESNAINEDAEFSFVIQFDTPYTYTPGQDVVMLVRHDGHGDVNGQETRWNFDGYAWAGGTQVSTGNVDDAVANLSFNVANRIQFSVVPEPTAVLLFCVGALVCGCRRVTL
jgi:hypothetical protein